MFWIVIFLPPVVTGLAGSLPALLASTTVEAAERKENLNAVKMSVYLLCKLTEILESDSHRRSIITAPGKVGCEITCDSPQHLIIEFSFFGGESPLSVICA